LARSHSDPADVTGTIATALARETRSLDDRLTLLGSRMVYTALAFFAVCYYFALMFLQIMNENGMWKPKGINHPPMVIGVVEVALVIAAGLIYFWGQWSGLYARKFAILQSALWVAGLLGLVAFGFHIYELHNPGFPLQTGYSSVFIATEGVFTALLGVSVIVLLGMANRARLGRFEASGVAVEAFGEYWGFVSAIALLNFLALYVQPFFPIG